MKIALIPARRGSVRVPDKNIRELNGIPLMAYSIKTALDCGLIDRVVVSTDSTDYVKIAEAHGAESLLRPADISTGNTPDLPVVEHFIKMYPDVSQIIYLRPTTPLREVLKVSKAIALFDSCCQHAFLKPDSLRSIEEMPESAYKCFVRNGDNLKGLMIQAKETNLPNHYYPETYKANGYVDIILPEVVKRCENVYGDIIKAFETPAVTEVDTEREFQFLEWEVGR